MNKHTSGPWSVCGDGLCSCKTVSCDDYPIAKITSGKWGDDFCSIRLVGLSLDLKAEAFMDQITYGEISEEIARANARLIGAAPDLLAFAEYVLEMDSTNNAPLFAKARAVILLATGVA